MNSSDPNELNHHIAKVLETFHPVDWDDIASILNQIKIIEKPPSGPHSEDFLKYFSRGTAFITFGIGIDGVSIETAKYAQIINDLFARSGDFSIHLIGGNFHRRALSMLRPNWQKYRIEGIDGWDKWDQGKWFKVLFRKRMRSFSEESDLIAHEIYRQAALIAKHMGRYFLKKGVSLVIPVNVASNPGNIALTLGLVLITEILGIHVLNINHDFYWEAGKSRSERETDEEPGVRDHFFRNIKNEAFFSLFKRLYPWNGSKWLQININSRQSGWLINDIGFLDEKVFEISTYIADAFFEPHSKNDVINIRQRMGNILSGGESIMSPVPIADHLSRVAKWMKKQRPIILGARSGLSVDPSSDALLIMLQPTRIVSRKRIERNLEMIRALFTVAGFREEFENNPNRQLVLHISGPAPIEHQEDLEEVLFAYQRTIRELPDILADRIFLAFSVGRDANQSFLRKRYQPLTIETLYRMADVVVFPSETEGRGLPIIESCASGVPLICSRYSPVEVFCEVIGENLPEHLQIRYAEFPEGKFLMPFLSEVADLLLHPGANQDTIIHNREAVRARYSRASFMDQFEHLLIQLHGLQ